MKKNNKRRTRRRRRQGKKKLGGGGEKVELQLPLLKAQAFFQTLNTSGGSCASREA